MFGWLKRENFVLPPEEYQRKLVSEIEEKLKDSKGSEKTRLTYMLANHYFLIKQYDLIDRRRDVGIIFWNTALTM